MFEATNFAGGAAAATFMFLLVSLVAVPYMIFQKRTAQ
jgi:ABC-type sugar transport system permease subunit